MQRPCLAGYLIMMVGASYWRPSLASLGLLTLLLAGFAGALRSGIGKRALGSQVRRGAVLPQEV